MSEKAVAVSVVYPVFFPIVADYVGDQLTSMVVSM